MNKQIFSVIAFALLLAPSGVARALTGLDVLQQMEQAVDLIADEQYSLARSYLAPALISPRINATQRSKAFYLRAFSFGSQNMYVSARKDLNRALEFNPENPGALYLLGRLHHFGRGTAVDHDTSLQLFEQAAELGHGMAQFHVGHAYVNGLGTEQDLAHGRELLQNVAEEGAQEIQGRAMLQLAASYRTPQAATPAPDQAVHWYERAIELGEFSALLSLGHMYQNSELGEAQPARAVALFDQALAQGVHAASVSLAYCYASGLGVAQDLARAVSLYRLGIEHNIAGSFVGLGYLYESGQGVAPSSEEAELLYRRGAEMGHTGAFSRLAYLLMRRGDASSLADATQWLGRAAQTLGSAQSHNDYAWLLATAKLDGVRDGELALQHAQTAVQLEPSAAHLDTLAAAYAELGQFEQAIDVQDRALATLTSEQPEDLAALQAELTEHLNAYKAQQPWRE